MCPTLQDILAAARIMYVKWSLCDGVFDDKRTTVC